MKEVFSSLFKGIIHITTPFSDSHPAIDMGNYKTRNPIYSPNRLGNGTVTKQTTSYTYKGVLYKNTLTQWITYDSGFESCTVHGSSADKILNVGDRVVAGQLVYRTGNTGYSFGDHLHYQLKKNGVLVDPTPYVTDDQNVVLFKVGDRVQFTDIQNIRVGSGTSFKVSGETQKEQIGTIKDGLRVADGYNWFDIQFDGGGTGWVADVGKFKAYVAPQVPSTPEPPVEPSELEKVKKELETANTTIKTITDDKKALEAELKTEKEEAKELNNNYGILLKERNRLSTEKNEAIRLLSEYKNSNIGKLVVFLQEIWKQLKTKLPKK